MLLVQGPYFESYCSMDLELIGTFRDTKTTEGH